MKRLETLGYLGPNRRAGKPVSELVMQPSTAELEALGEIIEQLRDALPRRLENLGLETDGNEWRDVSERAAGADGFLHLIAFCALTLQRNAGHQVGFRDAITETAPDGHPRWRAIWEHDDYHLGEISGDIAMWLCAEAAVSLEWTPTYAGEGNDLQASIKSFTELCLSRRTRPETLALIRGARARGIPVLRLDRAPYQPLEAEFRVSPNGMLMLGQCCHQVLLDGTFPVQQEGPGFALMHDRRTLWRFLASQGAPVPFREPDTLAAASLDRALPIAERLGYPVRVWPRTRDPDAPMGWLVESGQGLTELFARSQGQPFQVLIEPETEGRTLDLLVAGSGFMHTTLDGQVVRADDNLTQFALRATTAINTGMLRLVFRLTEQAPGIALVHLDPAPPFTDMLGNDNDLIDQAVRHYLELIVPPGAPHSVPLFAITGTNGKTTTSTMIAEVWMAAGKQVGLAQTEGIYFNGQEIEYGDLAGFRGHCKIFENPDIEVAVLETARGGVAKFGFAWPRCDVAVITTVSADHLGLQGIETVEQLAVLKRSVLERADKAVVLNVDNSHCRAMISALQEGPEARNICAVSMQRSAPDLLSEAGIDACCVLETINGKEWIVHHDGDTRSEVVATATIPSTRGGAVRFNVLNAMAASSAAIHGGAPLDAVQQAVSRFQCRPDNVPGRMNHYGGLPYQLILDHGHNPEALKALIEYVDSLPCEGRRIVLIPGMFNRLDELLKELAATLAGHFDHYVLSNYRTTEPENFERVPGLFREALLEQGVPDDQMSIVLEEWESIDYCLAMGEPGDLLVLQVGHDVFPEMQPRLKEMGAYPI